MVISSNRSPSPISTRPNPNSRTPETGTRKSFSGNPLTKPSNRRSFNPVTPANSPAEFTQRNCNEWVSSSRVSYEQKENEKDKDHNLKPVRARSPAVSSTGTKNFMAPTISAASKIAAASPRKKILGEAVVRVSDSISDEKLCNSELAEAIGSKTPITLEDLAMISETSNLLTTPKNNRSSIPVSAEKSLPNSINQLDFSVSEETQSKLDENLNSETKTMDSNKIKASPFSSPLAPLDADPSVPPYDPRTNYLSPRPLFLHYRPNPRIEVLLNKETEFNPVEGCKQLEDSFSSETHDSDGEKTEETHDSDVAEESEETHDSDSEEKEITTTTHLLHLNNDIVRVKKISRSKFIPLVLVLVVACLFFPVTDSPLYTSSDHQTSLKLENTVNIVGLAKTNLDGLAYSLKLWFVKSASFRSIPVVFEELGPLHAGNLTALDHELLVSQILDYGEMETEELQVENSLELMQDQNFMGLETDEKVEEPEMLEAPGSENQASLIPEASEVELEMLEVQNAVQIEIEELGSTEFEEQSPLIPELPEVEPIKAELIPQISESDTPSHSSEPEDGSSISNIETIESAIHETEDKFAQTVLGVSSVLLILMASTAFVYLRRKKGPFSTEAPVMVKELPSKKLSPSISLSAGDSQHPYIERLTSQNWPFSHVEMTGQSGPLEVSTSYQHSSSCNPMESERMSEAESQERKPRFASPPSEYSSPSYGSFTTYEKIQNKHGYGEDEVVTPVRRSSRIRKLVTSP